MYDQMLKNKMKKTWSTIVWKHYFMKPVVHLSFKVTQGGSKKLHYIYNIWK
jgi:hypothetical protein